MGEPGRCYSLRIPMPHDISHDSVTFRLASSPPGNALSQFEAGVESIVARETESLRCEVERLKGERDAIQQWAIKHAGYIGTDTRTVWWARGDHGRVEGKTALEVVRKAAGLESISSNGSRSDA